MKTNQLRKKYITSITLVKLLKQGASQLKSDGFGSVSQPSPRQYFEQLNCSCKFANFSLKMLAFISLKLVSAIFYQIFISHQMIVLQIL